MKNFVSRLALFTYAEREEALKPCLYLSSFENGKLSQEFFFERKRKDEGNTVTIKNSFIMRVIIRNTENRNVENEDYQNKKGATMNIIPIKVEYFFEVLQHKMKAVAVHEEDGRTISYFFDDKLISQKNGSGRRTFVR